MPPVSSDIGDRSCSGKRGVAKRSDSTTALCSHSGSDMKFLEELALKEHLKRKYGSAATFQIKKTDCETDVSSVTKQIVNCSDVKPEAESCPSDSTNSNMREGISLPSTSDEHQEAKTDNDDQVSTVNIDINLKDNGQTNCIVGETANGLGGQTMEVHDVNQIVFGGKTPVKSLEEDDVSADDSSYGDTQFESQVPQVVDNTTRPITDNDISRSLPDNMIRDDNHGHDILAYAANTASNVTTPPSLYEQSDNVIEHSKIQKSHYNCKMKEVSALVDDLLVATGLDYVLRKPKLPPPVYKRVLSDSTPRRDVNVSIPPSNFQQYKDDDSNINAILYSSVLDTRSESSTKERKTASKAESGSGVRSSRVLGNSTDEIYSNTEGTFLFESGSTHQPISMFGCEENKGRAKTLPPLHTSQSAGTGYQPTKPQRKPAIKSESNAPKQASKRINKDVCDTPYPTTTAFYVSVKDAPTGTSKELGSQSGATLCGSKAWCPLFAKVGVDATKDKAQRTSSRPIQLKSGAVWVDGKLQITIRGPTHLSPFDPDTMKGEMENKPASLDTFVQDGRLHLTARGLSGFLPPITGNQKCTQAADPVSLEVILVPEKKHPFARRKSRSRVYPVLNPKPSRKKAFGTAFTPLNRDVLEERALVSPFDTSLCPDKCPRLHSHRIASSRSEVTSKIGQSGRRQH